MSAGREVAIEYQWTDYQAEVRDALESGDWDVVVLRTGYGGGKSITGAQWIHRGALAADGGESLVMGQDLAKAESTTFRVFFERLPGEDTVPDDSGGDPENSPIVAGFNRNKNLLTYVTGHRVRLGGADRWNRFAGAEFQRIWCDEVAHYENTDLYRLHEMLATRQRTDQGPNTTLWTSTGNGYNQFYDITERQVDPDDDPLPWRDRLKVVRASTTDNVLLPEDGREKIRAQFEGTPREAQGLHGGFAAAEGLVYDQFSRATHVVERDAVDVREDWRIYGYDYGYADPRVLLEIGKTPADQYVVLDLYHRRRQPVEDLVDPSDGSGWLLERDKPEGRIYCDHDPEHIEKFRRAGFDAEAATKDLDEGISELRGVLEPDPAMDGQPGLLVADGCTPLIQEFLDYQESEVGTARAVDHCLDSLRYAVMGDRYGDADPDLEDLGW